MVTERNALEYEVTLNLLRSSLPLCSGRRSEKSSPWNMPP